ncbi:MAG: long-chain fatty acid--CoA ligase [Leptospiraceae bacterium]|nr:long-chain fatty acid--CoA ligase [Leptospiraceae bacterium]
MKLDPKKLPRPWLKFYDKEVPPTLDYPKESLPELFQKSCQENGHKVALKFLGKSLTYAQIERSANAFAHFFSNRGITKNDRVMLMLPNSPHFVIAYYALLKIGAIVVPISPLDTPAEANYKFENSDSKLLVYLDLLHEKVSDILQKYSALTAVVADVAEFLPFPKNMLFRLRKKTLKKPLPDLTRPNTFTFGQVLRQYLHENTFPTASIDPQKDPAVIIYTGGTTGVSKGVVLSHYALVVNMTQAKYWGHLEKSDVALNVLPFFHGFGLSIGLNLCLAHGGSMILMPRWDAGQALRHFEKDGVTVFAGVPTMYLDMLHHKNFAKLKKARLKGCYVGAAPVPESLKKAFHEKTGGILIEGYGLTEAVTAKCANPYLGPKKEKSIGIPWPDTVMAIVDDKGNLQRIGKEGEIILHSPDLMMGYWKNPDATKKTIRGGWLFTGDIGKMDKDGYFYIVDRKKDLIITGGYNVYPAEVEEVLYTHPAVREAVVIGVPDERLGEVPKAFLVLKEGTSVTEEEIRNFCKQKLIHYKVPRYVEVRESLPKSPIGKILRKELKKELATSSVKKKRTRS